MAFVLIGVSAHPVWIGLIFAYFFGFKSADADQGYALPLPPGQAAAGRCNGPTT